MGAATHWNRRMHLWKAVVNEGTRTCGRFASSNGSRREGERPVKEHVPWWSRFLVQGG